MPQEQALGPETWIIRALLFASVTKGDGCVALQTLPVAVMQMCSCSPPWMNTSSPWITHRKVSGRCRTHASRSEQSCSCKSFMATSLVDPSGAPKQQDDGEDPQWTWARWSESRLWKWWVCKTKYKQRDEVRRQKLGSEYEENSFGQSPGLRPMRRLKGWLSSIKPVVVFC